MANYRARPSSLYEGQEVLDQMGRVVQGSNMTNPNYATYLSQHLNHLTQQQQQQQQQQLINNAFSSSNVNLQNLVQQNLQTRLPNGGSPNNTNPSPYVQQPYSTTTDLHRFAQNADKYTTEVSVKYVSHKLV